MHLGQKPPSFFISTGNLEKDLDLPLIENILLLYIRQIGHELVVDKKTKSV